MKTLKALLVTLSAVLLTGCYTQLRYSQTMHRITDDRGGYYDQDEYYDEGYYDDGYIPVYYKNYEYAEFWAECGCNPYRDYYSYSGYPYDNWRYGYHWPYYGSFIYYNGNPFWPWRHRSHFRNTFTFSVSFGWGAPYYHSFFYDPFYYSGFYHPFYGYRPIAYNYYYFYNPGGFYYDGNDRVINNRRYGPRSLGTNRVIDRSDRSRVRSRSATIDRTNSVRSRSEVRTRSVGQSRTREAVNRTRNSSVRSREHSVERSRARNEHSQRIRSRIENRNDDKSVDRQTLDRPREIRQRDRRSVNNQLRMIDYRSNREKRIEYRQKIQKRLRNMTVPKINIERRERSRPSFYQRLKNFRSFFDSNNSRIMNRSDRSSGRSVRTKSSSSHSRPSVQRSSSRSRSSVTRSRSSSNSSRSRDTSSRSSSSRSRGNN